MPAAAAGRQPPSSPGADDDDEDSEGRSATPPSCVRRHALGTYRCYFRYEETDSERCSDSFEVTRQGQGHRSVRNRVRLFPPGCFPATLISSEAPRMCQEVQMILKTCPLCPRGAVPNRRPGATHRQETLETPAGAEIGPAAQI